MATSVPPLHDVDIRLLRLFKAVVDCEGFAAAEDTLGVGRSTISKHISDLEARMGVRLCERGRSGFALTPHGRIVYESGLELLDSLDRFRSQVSSAKGELTGDISLWVMDSTPLEVGNPLSHALDRFVTRTNKVHLAINTAAPHVVEDAIGARRAHVGLSVAKSDIPALDYLPVGYEATSLYCSSKHELAERPSQFDKVDFSHYNLVMRRYNRSPHGFRGQSWSSSATAYHVEGTVQLILSGRFVGILPDHIATRWVSTGHMVRIPLAQTQRRSRVYVIYLRQQRNIPLIKALVEDIAKSYKDVQSERR